MTRSTLNRGAILALAAGLTATPALAAPFQYVTTDRRVVASALFVGSAVIDEIAAPSRAMGPFVETAEVDRTEASGHVLSRAEQDSHFFTSRVVASGSALVSITGDTGAPSGAARSRVSLTFEIMEASEYWLSYEGEGTASLLTTGAPGFQFIEGATAIDETGMLQPGRYTLIVEAYSFGIGRRNATEPVEIFGSYNLDLRVAPTPGGAGLLALIGLGALRRRRAG